MLLFKRILKQPEMEKPAERRSATRYVVNPSFPIKAVLSFIGRDDTRGPVGVKRSGWTWKGRLLDCSELGARLQMSSSRKVEARDLCDLKLVVDDFELTVPCHIANIREQADGLLFGLKHDLEDETIAKAYRQLLEVLALGSTLKAQTKPAQPDASGYLVERYVSDRPSRLCIWRNAKDESIAAFEFQLKDNIVRVAAGHPVQYMTVAGSSSRTASEAKAREIQRLFNWVLPNLSPAVPADVRELLQRYSASTEDE